MDSSPLEGLWVVKFLANPPRSGQQSIGAGVVVFMKDRALGGDSQYYYDGQVTVANDIVNAEISVRLHNRTFGGQSIFGTLETFNLLLTGKLGDREVVLTGRLKEIPGEGISIHCTKVKGLP